MKKKSKRIKTFTGVGIIRQDKDYIKAVADNINMKGRWAVTIREIEQTAYDANFSKFWTADHTIEVVKYLISLYEK